MNTTLIIILCVGLAIAVTAILYYNRFIRYRNRIATAWSDIDVQLKRRHDLVPSLVQIVQAYATHEKNLFVSIAGSRKLVMDGDNSHHRAAAENRLAGDLRDLFVLVENYPSLLADQSFRKLQEQLGTIEDDIQYSRRYYNAVVRDNNIAVRTFPGVLFAALFGFKEAPFFEIDILDREAIHLNLTKDGNSL